LAHSSFCSQGQCPTRRDDGPREGKIPTTSVRRVTSLLRCSRGLSDWAWLQISRAKTVKGGVAGVEMDCRNREPGLQVGHNLDVLESTMAAPGCS
jgi:hypothetical protein